MPAPLYSKDLSFVVIGRNAEWSIGRLLDSILARAPSGVTKEIIYVDSASTDRTVEIVSRYPARIVCLPAGSGLCAAAGRHVGCRYATGRCCVFIDSDMELLSGWLERALRVLECHSDIAAVSGIQVDVDRAAKPEDEGSGYSADADDNFAEITFAGSAAVFRREALERAGSWNPYIVSDEEPELCIRIRRAGYRIVQLACVSVRHYGYAPPTISCLLSRRRRRLFLGYGQVIRYHLRTGLLPMYLRERGWMVTPVCIGLAVVIAALLSWGLGNPVWIGGVLGALLLGIALDALRSRSLSRAAYHLLHRALIVEGTVKGLMMRRPAPDEYKCEAVVLEPDRHREVSESVAEGVSWANATQSLSQ